MYIILCIYEYICNVWSSNNFLSIQNLIYTNDVEYMLCRYIGNTKAKTCPEDRNIVLHI